MAIYVSTARRRRRLIVATVVAAVAGLTMGAVIGRSSAPTISEKIDTSRARGRDVAASLTALPTEYEQSLAGSDPFDPAAALQSSRRRLTEALQASPWLGRSERDRATKALDEVAAAASKKVDAETFSNAVDDAVAVMTAVFGID